MQRHEHIAQVNGTKPRPGPRGGRWKIHLASLLLVVGVALVAASAETGVPWWAVPGGLCLMFVPALTADYARGE